MNCKCFEETIFDYIRKKTTPEASKEFEEHITTCNSCKEKYNEYSFLNNILLQYDDIEPQCDFVSTIRTRISETNRIKLRKRRLNVFLLSSAAILLITFSIFLLYKNISPKIETPTANQPPVEVLENMDLLENLEFYDCVDLLSDEELINNLGSILESGGVELYEEG